MTLNDATYDEILKSSGLYGEMIRIMKVVDGKAPVGSCCGKNKSQHVNTFLINKEKYINMVEKIKNRTIMPKWKGIIYITKAGTHFDSKTMTDDVAKMIIEKGWLTPVEKYFEIPVEEKKEPEVKIEDLKTEDLVEAPVEKKPRKKKSTNKKK